MNNSELTELRKKLPKARWIGDEHWPLVAYATRDWGAIVLIGYCDTPGRFITGKAFLDEEYVLCFAHHLGMESAMTRYMSLVAEAVE